MNRIHVAALSFSTAGFIGLVAHEGWTETAIVPTKGDVPTVGPGLTKRPDGTPVRMGDRVTPIEGIQRSYAHIAKDETKLKGCIKAPLHQYEYDTLVDHAYQYGAGVTCNSQVVRLANEQKYPEACQAYLNFKYMTSPTPYAGWEPFRFDTAGKPIRWRYDCTTPGNKICAGVGKRSQERVKSCMGGV